MIQKNISEQIKQAMLAKNVLRLNVLRGLSSAFVNELVAQKKKPQEKLPDEDVLNVIRRAIKQRKDSIEQFKKGGREDLVKSEEDELAILQIYLPQMMSIDEIKKVVETKKIELGVTDKSKVGPLMSVTMKELKGKADGSDVKKVVEELFK